MLQRWLVVIVGLPLLLAAFLLCPSWATLIVVCGISAAAAYELLHTAGKKVPKCVYAATILAAVVLEWVIYDEHTWQFYDGYQSIGMIRILCEPLTLVTFLFFIAVKGYGKPNAMPFADVATAIVGGIVFPMMYSSIFLLRMDPEYGRMYVLLPFCVAFIGDSLSMYGGMLFGKRKMAPGGQPHKHGRVPLPVCWAAHWGWCFGAQWPMHGLATRRIICSWRSMVRWQTWWGSWVIFPCPSSSARPVSRISATCF